MSNSPYPPNVNLEEIGVEEQSEMDDIQENTDSLEEKLEALEQVS